MTLAQERQQIIHKDDCDKGVLPMMKQILHGAREEAKVMLCVYAELDMNNPDNISFKPEVIRYRKTLAYIRKRLAR